ncbi:MAG TPA: carboxypeptidase-like regulatory domain-containing protein, partial [Vicinamibacterales bacterium]
LDVGQQASGLDFWVVEDVLSTLTVKVTTSTGVVPASFVSRIQRVGAPAGDVRCIYPPGSAAQCRNVPPGDYWVIVAARPGPAAPVEYSTTRVKVDGHDRDLVVATVPGSAVSGRVDADGGLPLPPKLQVVALDTEYEVPAPAPGQPAAPPMAPVLSGAFTLSGLVGPRLFRVSGLPDGWILRSVRLGGTDITDTPTTLGSTSAAPLQLVVTPQTGSIGGTVLDVTGQAAAGSRVVVFSSDPRTWGARSRFIATGEVAATGRYLLHGLLPGTYLVAAVSDLPDGAWEDPERLARLQPTAAAVAIAAGVTATLDWRPR